MVASVAFMELGQAALTKNDVWLTIAVARSIGVIDQIEGGWSTMLRVLVEDLFLGPLGISSAGFPLMLPSGATIFYATLASALADGDGLRQAYDWRGASSLKPCLLHLNVLRKVKLKLVAAKRLSRMRLRRPLFALLPTSLFRAAIW